MDDSLFARLGYDPARIHAHFYGQPAPGGIARLGGPAKAEEVTGGGPGPASAESAEPPSGAEAGPTGMAEAGEDPPPAGEGDHLKGGGGALASGLGVEGQDQPHVPLHQPADGPPRRAAEELDPAEVERRKLMSAWLGEHWEIVEAMARAGEAPRRPSPPPPPPPPKADPAERLRVHVARGDRWNKPKMAEFLRQLASTHSVSAAARAVGMHRRSAYKLRARLKGQPFDIAWEAAFRHGYDDLAHAALELALEGEDVPHYYQGELKGTHRKRNPQLMVQLLKMRNRAGAPMLGRYGAAAEYWSENWERLVHRIETGSVTWDDEHEALGDEERARLDLPDAKREADQIIARNLPDEPGGRFGR